MLRVNEFCAHFWLLPHEISVAFRHLSMFKTYFDFLVWPEWLWAECETLHWSLSLTLWPSPTWPLDLKGRPSYSQRPWPLDSDLSKMAVCSLMSLAMSALSSVSSTVRLYWGFQGWCCRSCFNIIAALAGSMCGLNKGSVCVKDPDPIS